ncbi:MAG: hypothetical protein EOO60_01975 [Hymenobacter sp.]|nr:MAG: hypothetical protein EOO60_01975 [Hymenobacter sp.]
MNLRINRSLHAAQRPVHRSNSHSQGCCRILDGPRGLVPVAWASQQRAVVQVGLAVVEGGQGQGAILRDGPSGNKVGAPTLAVNSVARQPRSLPW